MRTSIQHRGEAVPKALKKICRGWPEAAYYLAKPSCPRPDAPVLVSIHGISRNARDHAATFAPKCSRLGWFVVAPLFTNRAYPNYQMLGLGGNRRGPRPDLALNAILDDVCELTGADTRRVFLFGYSGGGQFAHRYAMLHPGRVMSAVLGAPGWFTFPDYDQPFPRGLARAEAALASDIELQRFLQLPISVMVGSEDSDRDEALNASGKIDRQQGLTRQERGQRWIEALGRASAEAGIDGHHEYVELAGCGHSFTECMATGHMDVQALDFFIRTQDEASGKAVAVDAMHQLSA